MGNHDIIPKNQYPTPDTSDSWTDYYEQDRFRFVNGIPEIFFNLTLFEARDTNLVWDSATQSGTDHKSGTRNVYQFSNDCKSNFMTLFTFW